MADNYDHWLERITHYLSRITDTLESRPCNCSAASSAGSGGTVGSASSDASATANKSSAGSAFGAESTPPDPVSAAIRADPKPAPVVKAEPAGETAWDRFNRFCIEKNASAVQRGILDAFVAAEVAAAKAKPHAETAEEVAEKIVFRNVPYESKQELVRTITAAIRRERGEA